MEDFVIPVAIGGAALGVIYFLQGWRRKREYNRMLRERLED